VRAHIHEAKYRPTMFQATQHIQQIYHGDIQDMLSWPRSSIVRAAEA